ncbi:MAG TPA: hypothetical protein VFX37_08235 [Pseudolabrys sp.]|nr:hypothetical protein [Pseudolabrys sp.]
MARQPEQTQPVVLTPLNPGYARFGLKLSTGTAEGLQTLSGMALG